MEQPKSMNQTDQLDPVPDGVQVAFKWRSGGGRVAVGWRSGLDSQVVVRRRCRRPGNGVGAPWESSSGLDNRHGDPTRRAVGIFIRP